MNIVKLLGRIIVTPITVVADVITMGGVLTDEEQSYTGNNLKKMLKEITDED
jgi:hypothetical protein